MENAIVICIIIIVVAVGIYSTVKHFKGEGGCCGGGSYKPKRKKLSNVIYTKTFVIDGMHCEHCKNRIEEIVNDIDGTAGRVNLKKGELTVSYSADIDDNIIKNRIERVGYTVSSITKN